MGTKLNRSNFIIYAILMLYQMLGIQNYRRGSCYAQNVAAIFIFGDSLVDAGNNFYIDTTARPVYPNGIDFVNGSPSGRYTNARTTTDIIGEELGFTNFTPPYLNPNTTGDVILKGVNYASSGAGILSSTGLLLGAPIPMEEQINNFAKTRQDIISRIGVAAAQALLTQSLYIVSAGSNDIFGGEGFSTTSPNIYLDNLLSQFKSQLTRLYNLDARKIMVTNVAVVGCIPFEKDTHLYEDDCVESVNELAKSYNIQLKNLLQLLTSTLPGSTYVYADGYAMLEDILQNYQSYGFENAKLACCQVVGRHGGLVPCGGSSRVCEDRSKYVFWDPYHTTEAANLILAKHSLDGAQNYVSPINLRQLVINT